ncbi:class I fructose-bisphosphate aldolase [Candidatus Nitronereus thalassa]|uniref:fructose-bisphosphate aldolase n=1 Tax=Candidatus Nitronereus thalassa TaxID=3020898 RepID=A0ABU3K4F5_9BACT|nr:class I fructose-bisphosphate aldolase [Candidatus Nitronereus thalassa]MDT7041256.1 class I fructose-bisphosphate aldolase [Candidatus Nitronereus thalassa]
MTKRVQEILSYYQSDAPGIRANLARLLMSGRLGGTGRLVILPVDQGFEHGPARSFAPNPPGYNPHYHFQLGIEAGCNAYAAPLGFLEAGAAEFAGQIPLILKLNNSDSLYGDDDPNQAVTGSVDDALRLGCCAVGYTIYPGSAYSQEMYENLREIALEARSVGLAVVVWSYPRGGTLSKAGQTGIDVACYAAQIAAQLGAHIIKVKVPTDHIEQAEAKKVYEAEKIPISTPTDRIRHVVQSAFDGRRIVIFSGGAKGEDQKIFDEARAIRDGGGFGSIIGRNSFQRSKPEALKFLETVMKIYSGEIA